MALFAKGLGITPRGRKKLTDNCKVDNFPVLDQSVIFLQPVGNRVPSTSAKSAVDMEVLRKRSSVGMSETETEDLEDDDGALSVMTDGELGDSATEVFWEKKIKCIFSKHAEEPPKKDGVFFIHMTFSCTFRRSRLPERAPAARFGPSRTRPCILTLTI